MRILVTDDDPALAKLVRALLEDEGHAVDVAGTREEARTLGTSGDYGAMVLDLELPDGNAISLIADFRKAGLQTPILVLTATKDENTTVRALDAGADDYLTKPFNVTVLQARMRALVRRGASSTAERLAAGNVVFSRVGRSVTVGGKGVRLTVKQLAILEQLLLRVGNVVTRAQLLESVFDLKFDPGTNVLDVNVLRLRRALDAAKADVKIEAERGVGFRLEG